MNVLLNFVPLKTGGGVQVGLDFLSNVGVLGKNHRWFLVCTENTPFASVALPDNCHRLKVVKGRLIGRVLFEWLFSRALLEAHDIDVIYTQFGPPWPASKVRNVVGCAYSNLFYPEINFWAGNSFLKRLERKVFDFARLHTLKKADVVIFETKDLSERAVKQNILRSDQSTYCLPAVSRSIANPNVPPELRRKIDDLPRGFKLCLISGYGKHKNFETLVDVLWILKNKHGAENIFFVITLAESNKNLQALIKHAEEKGVAEFLVNIGPVPYDACGEIYKNCQGAILLSTLESFSNNIAEAWATKTPLVISDMDWSKSLCGDGALYVKHNDPDCVAENLVRLSGDKVLREGLVKAGLSKLSEYPDSERRFLRYLNIIEGSV